VQGEKGTGERIYAGIVGGRKNHRTLLLFLSLPGSFSIRYRISPISFSRFVSLFIWLLVSPFWHAWRDSI
jgi:hypothetical protein